MSWRPGASRLRLLPKVCLPTKKCERPTSACKGRIHPERRKAPVTGAFFRWRIASRKSSQRRGKVLTGRRRHRIPRGPCLARACIFRDSMRCAQSGEMPRDASAGPWRFLLMQGVLPPPESGITIVTKRRSR